MLLPFQFVIGALQIFASMKFRRQEGGKDKLPLISSEPQTKYAYGAIKDYSQDA